MHAALTRLLNWTWYQPNPVKWLLWPFSAIFQFVSAVNSALYRFGLKRVSRLPVPVIVVGNISVGGTGKTPCVIWLANKLKAQGYRVGIVSRGYGGNARVWPQSVEPGSDPDVVGDEPVLIARSTGCRVFVAPRRAVAARALLETHEVDVILSDDGLQHYALARDLEIAVVDAERGLGNGFCLPAGPLREPASRLDRVDVVLINGSGAWACPGAVNVGVELGRPYRLKDTEVGSLAHFDGRQVHAVAAIGNPERFFTSLERAGLVVLRHPFPDHTRMQPRNFEFHDKLPVLITEKDAVKIHFEVSDNVWCVPLKLRFEADHGERLMRRVIEAIST